MRCSNKEGHYFRGSQCSKYAPQNSKEIIAEQLSEIAENLYREAETVPVVTEQAETERDAVNHPSHYTAGGIECIDCIKAVLGQNFMGFLIGNVIKYTYRYKDKNGAEDLKKARWYLDRAIKELENDKVD
jgi:hypothetical protein